MHLQTLLERIEKSPEFKDFKKKNKNPELTAAFMILDVVKNIGDYSLDYLAGKNKIASFTVSSGKEGISFKEEEILDKSKKLGKLGINKVTAGIDKAKHLLQEEMKINSIDKKLEKIIAVLHTDSEGKTIWNLTCVCQGLIIISALIDAEKGKMLKFEKRGLFDFVIPVRMAGAMEGLEGMESSGVQKEEKKEKEEKKDKKRKKEFQSEEKEAPEYIQ